MLRSFLLYFFPLFLFVSCSETKVIDDLGDASFQLLDQDSVSVNFPDDYKGKYVVMGFIYTNCPDICPLVTQNMMQIQEGLNDPEDVHFLGITFDPKRDTPAVLSDYKKVFELNERFDFLTGDSLVIAQLMDSVRVRSNVSMSTTTDDGRELYFLNHSDKIMVMNPDSEVIIEYGGSMPQVPKLIIQDLNYIR